MTAFVMPFSSSKFPGMTSMFVATGTSYTVCKMLLSFYTRFHYVQINIIIIQHYQ